MKRSKAIALVLITGLLASCHKHHKKPQRNDVYIRSDVSAPYTYCGGNNFWLWYYAFRPYGMYYGGYYHHVGYYSGAISERSNIGSSAMKGGVIRGGFGEVGGGHAVSVSS